MRPDELQDRLAKLEALFRRAGTIGEKQAAGAAIERLKRKAQDHPVELKLSLGDIWAVRLFIAICRKHGVEPYRYARQRRTTVMVRVSETFFDQAIYPEFCELQAELVSYFQETTDHLIKTALHSDGDDSDLAPNAALPPKA